jgi:hypothetical protein
MGQPRVASVVLEPFEIEKGSRVPRQGRMAAVANCVAGSVFRSTKGFFASTKNFRTPAIRKV